MVRCMDYMHIWNTCSSAQQQFGSSCFRCYAGRAKTGNVTHWCLLSIHFRVTSEAAKKLGEFMRSFLQMQKLPFELADGPCSLLLCLQEGQDGVTCLLPAPRRQRHSYVWTCLNVEVHWAVLEHRPSPNDFVGSVVKKPPQEEASCWICKIVWMQKFLCMSKKYFHNARGCCQWSPINCSGDFPAVGLEAEHNAALKRLQPEGQLSLVTWGQHSLFTHGECMKNCRKQALHPRIGRLCRYHKGTCGHNLTVWQFITLYCLTSCCS